MKANDRQLAAQKSEIFKTIERTRTFLQQDNPRESVIQIPEVDAAHPALVVQLAVYIEGLVGRNLQLPHPLTRNGAILEGRVELIAPRGPVAVAIPVVVAEQVVAAGFGASPDLEGLVYGGEEIFGQLRDKSRDRLQVAFRVSRRETAEEVTGEKDRC